MRIRVTFLTLLLAFVGADLMFAQAQFDTSLHKTRQGKFTAYAKENGGMELITDIPMQDLSCWKCHSGTGKDAAGNDIDPPPTLQPVPTATPPTFQSRSRAA